MIKFFRKIRQSLLNDGKTTKYFKYAVGEIILVMIGILLALQVSNWNEKRNNKTKLESYILTYKDVLKFNLQLFDNNIKGSEYYIKRNINTLQIRNFDSIPLDSLENWIETFYVNFDTKNFVHESFKNSQITDFGKYDTIINRMQVYYTWGYAEIAEVIRQHNDAVDKADDFWRFQQNSYELNYNNDSKTSLQTKKVRKERIVKLIKSPRARNILKLDIRKKKATIEWLKEYKKRSINNILQINRTLNLKDETIYSPE